LTKVCPAINWCRRLPLFNTQVTLTVTTATRDGAEAAVVVPDFALDPGSGEATYTVQLPDRWGT
jgi:hypothetical protein